jgi:hypothetical protein
MYSLKKTVILSLFLFMCVIKSSQSIEKSCLYDFKQYRTPIFDNCYLIASKNKVFEIYISPDEGTYSGQLDYIPFTEKSPNIRTLTNCPSQQKAIFKKMVSGMKEAQKQQCEKGKILKEDEKLCSFVLRNSFINWDYTKKFFRLFANGLSNQMGIVKLKIDTSSSPMKGKLNLSTALINIKRFEKTEFGFLKGKAESSLNVLVNDSKKSSLSLSGGFGALDYEGSCES